MSTDYKPKYLKPFNPKVWPSREKWIRDDELRTKMYSGDEVPQEEKAELVDLWEEMDRWQFEQILSNKL